MDLATINARVDQALADNRRAERIIITMALAVFSCGILALLLAYWLKNPYIGTGSVLAQAFLVFPINEIRKLRRDNVILQTFPSLIHDLPPNKAAVEIVKLLSHLRGAK